MWTTAVICIQIKTKYKRIFVLMRFVNRVTTKPLFMPSIYHHQRIKHVSTYRSAPAMKFAVVFGILSHYISSTATNILNSNYDKQTLMFLINDYIVNVTCHQYQYFVIFRYEVSKYHFMFKPASRWSENNI